MRKTEILNHFMEVGAEEAESFADVPDVAEEVGMPTEALEVVIGRVSAAAKGRYTPPDAFASSTLYGSSTLSAGLVEQAFKMVEADNPWPSLLTYLGSVLLPRTRANFSGDPAPATLTFGSGLAACADAEGYFYDAGRQVFGRKYRTQPQVSIYCGTDGRPLAFRKSKSESSALTLEPLLASGMTLPAGTIVGLDKDRTTQTGEAIRSRSKQRFKLKTYQVDGPIEVTPLRLSAWAYREPLDRAIFGFYDDRGELYYDAGRGQKARELDIEDFRRAACMVTSACGV